MLVLKCTKLCSSAKCRYLLGKDLLGRDLHSPSHRLGGLADAATQHDGAHIG